ncbi:alkaline phosphatase family protein [Photobacterium sp. WH77]|uniref:alkaline phosphatase D family protein n=1 Tax=unclassified Photobacterium TaxID=2628852 RepID=UPI001EDC69DB|nr:MULTISPECIES: alkaline phosphatase D family protein [unclassified Photobacterium]MCG2838310.1 alkaline phosphatase family protein [Photobacterium sp. WH77]MCG2845975.1 alkaline phosphatase family protein [Photobacterium sp. WH80]
MTANSPDNNTHNATRSHELPLFLTGPVLRRCNARVITLWMVTSAPLEGQFQLFQGKEASPFFQADFTREQQIRIGQSAWVVMAQFSGDFPLDTELAYDIDTQKGALTALLPELLYPGEERLTLTIKSRADYIQHGSCRNPHFPGKDSLVAADEKVATLPLGERPALLMMSGDQIYADHVAGPTLDAISQVIDLLGLPDETFTDAPYASLSALRASHHQLYGRDQVLPVYEPTGNWLSDTRMLRWLPAKQRPVFTANECENHLIGLSEFLAMYLLVWSPNVWQLVETDRLEKQGFQCGEQVLADKWQQLWQQEKTEIEEFISGLVKVQRLVAHIPTYMIFDDHDVTDDWNLTVGWEQAAYQHAFSKRIIGNSLFGYWLCQGWGNDPEQFDDTFMAMARTYFSAPDTASHDAMIDHLYDFEHWHYQVETKPKMLVLDTRTRRWHSESKMNKPSGLMDWEALTEMQQALIHEPAVIIVSPAPIFGVKFIETLQRIMTLLGKPLVVDAENWMAHPGAANTLLSIFTHTKTPTHFVIISGDVHYSFAYDVQLRFRRNSPNIYQITASGIKNTFPEKLLRVCERMDRLLYSPHSPLNWFTKRKRMKIYKRDPDTPGHGRLVNSSCIGELWLKDDGQPERIAILTAEGQSIGFPPTRQEQKRHSGAGEKATARPGNNES